MNPIDERLTDVPMTPVQCRRCAAVVGVRKSTWSQTSVQWDDAARRQCAELDVEVPLTEQPMPYCDQLRYSIWEAVESGRLPIVTETFDDEEVPADLG